MQIEKNGKGSLLPKEKSKRKLTIPENTFLWYGPEGVGKSTFWAQEDSLFADCENTLGGLEVFRSPVTDWITFSFLCAEFIEGNHPFTKFVIDPIERLFKFCQEYMMKKHDIEHPSDMDWGKGWSMLSDEFTRPIVKMANSKYCLVMISHKQEKEIKMRTKTSTIVKPNLQGSGPNSAYSTVVNISDYIAYMTFGSDNIRKLELNPTDDWVAKKRHQEMPDEIILPPEPHEAFAFFQKIWKEKLQ